MRTSEGTLTCPVGTAAGVDLRDAAAAKHIAMVPLPDLPDAYGLAGCFAGVCGGTLLVAGGANFPDGVMPWDGGRKVWHSGVFALDLAEPGTGCHRVGDLPKVAGYGVSVSLPTGVLLVGGSGPMTHFRTTRLLRWNHGKLAIDALAPLPIPLSHACGAVVDGQVQLKPTAR